MSLRSALAAAVMFAVVALPTAASAQNNRVVIKYVTPTVTPGGVLTVRAETPFHTTCSPIAYGPHDASMLGLGVRHHTKRRTTWRYTMPLTAKAGRWHLSLMCYQGGVATRYFHVGVSKVSPAQIQVGKTGFYEQTYGSSSPPYFLECGVQLENTSTSDARNVGVQVSFIDTTGRSVATSQATISLIPAGKDFWLSCINEVSVSLTVASIQVQVHVGESLRATGSLPTVSGLTLTTDSSALIPSETLTGNVTNTYTMPTSPEATIYAVYYDASGDFVGSSLTTTGAAIEPGATVVFSFPYVPTSATTAEVSVDPCAAYLTTGACPPL